MLLGSIKGGCGRDGSGAILRMHLGGSCNVAARGKLLERQQIVVRKIDSQDVICNRKDYYNNKPITIATIEQGEGGVTTMKRGMLNNIETNRVNRDADCLPTRSNKQKQ